MSTFCGKMKEMDYISIDEFRNDNLKSHAFFLSHCHADHMQGLKSNDFYCALQKNNAYLYMSNISKTILEKMIPSLSSRIQVLDISSQNFIEIPSINKIISVILIPAGHCPGSVMFLFESDTNVLYTGDIRIRSKELQKCKHLYDSTGILKQIDHLYLDTTFLLKCYEYFPLREESITAFCDFLNKWLNKNEKNCVEIITPANYGSEYLFMEIFKRCKQSICVTKEKYDVYNKFPEMDNVITCDESPRIKIYNNARKADYSENKLILKPSALCWKNITSKNDIIEKRDNKFHVCYSSHSSYGELIDIIKFLKPKKISPNVLQKNIESNEEMEKIIKDILEEIHKPDDSSEDSCEKLFVNKTDWSNANICDKKCDNEVEIDDVFFNLLDSPESKRQKI